MRGPWIPWTVLALILAGVVGASVLVARDFLETRQRDAELVRRALGPTQGQSPPAIVEDDPVSAAGQSLTTRLHEAAKEGNTDQVRKYLDAGDSIEARDMIGATPLMYAALNGRPEVGRLLIKRGAKVNAKSDGQMTPLHLAAAGGRTSMLQLLLENGALVNATDSKGVTPLEIARTMNRDEAVRLLTIKGGKEVERDPVALGDLPELYKACHRGDIAQINRLLANGADINAQDNKGNSALMHGVIPYRTKNVIATAKLLLEKGADVNMRNSLGATPLRVAATFGSAELAELLLAHGASVDAIGNDGSTPLCIATIQGHLRVVEVLIAKAADVNSNCGDETPLSMAKRLGRPSIAEELMRHKAR